MKMDNMGSGTNLSLRSVICLLLVPSCFALCCTLPELFLGSPDINDNNLHIGLANAVVHQLLKFNNPIDFWIPDYICGYPVFHTYPHLSYLIIAFVHIISFKILSVPFLVHLVYALCITAFPLSIYVMLRKFDQPFFIALAGAWLAPIITSGGGYGLELESYLWLFGGLFNQAIGMAVTPLALGYTCKALEGKHGWFPAVLLNITTFLSHVIFGFVMLASSLTMVLIPLDYQKTMAKAKRFLVLFGVVGAVIAYFYFPILLDNAYQAVSPYDSISKIDSYGLQTAVTRFVNGDLFEKGRFPILSISVFIGMLVAFSGENKGAWFFLLGFFCWFIFYCGRPFLGNILDLIPMIRSLHLERLIAAVQIMGVGLAAIAIGHLIHYLYHLNGNFKGAGALWLVGLILLVLPGLVDRGRYAAGSYCQALGNKREYIGHYSEFRPVAQYIQKTIKGRLFPGSKAGWGSEYKIGQVPVYLFFMTQPRPPILGYMPFTWSLACDFSSYVYQYRPAYYDLFNVEYILAPTEIKPGAFFQPIFSSGRHHLYKIKTRGYFHLVETPGLVFANKYTIWKFNQLWLKSRLLEQDKFFVIDFRRQQDPKAFDLAVSMKDDNTYTVRNSSEEKSIIADPPFESLYSSTSKNLGKEISETHKDGVYRCRVDVSQSCCLLFSMSYHPGWRVTVDGISRKPVMLTPGLTGVHLEPGTHDVKFFYAMPWYKLPLFFLAVVVMGALMFHLVISRPTFASRFKTKV
jgi:hypothetical protein